MPDQPPLNPPETLPELKVRPDFAALVAAPGPDGVHIQLRINCDVTPLSEPRQKLLLHLVTRALSEATRQVKALPKLDVLATLGKLERAGHGKENPPLSHD